MRQRRPAYLIRDVLAELAAGRRDVEREHAALVGVPDVEHVVADLEDVPRLLGAAGQTRLNVLEQALLVQAQQVRARRHPLVRARELRDTRLWRQTRATAARTRRCTPPHGGRSRAANFGP